MERTSTRTGARTRLPEQLRRDAEDAAANRRISMRIFALPAATERRIEGQFYLGAGVDGERRLMEALDQIRGKEELQ